MADLASSIKGLLSSKKYSDLTIICQRMRFKVHCAVVCTRSPVFAAAIDGNFKESISREIDLSKDELPIIQALINYLYTGNYDDTSGLQFATNSSNMHTPKEVKGKPFGIVLEEPIDATNEDDGWGVPAPRKFVAVPLTPDLNANALVFNVKMYIAGDKYDIPGLKVLAKEKYKTTVPHCWNTTAFSESVRLLLEETVESDVLLKQVVLQTVASNVTALLDRGEFVDILKSHGDLAVEVLRISFGSSKQVELRTPKGNKWGRKGLRLVE